jgi:hypothetical protein
LRAALVDLAGLATLVVRGGTRLALASREPNLRPMKHRCLVLFLATTFVALFASPGQTPAPKPDEQELLTLVKAVQAQQAQIVANQTNIETKLAEITETIRVARIFAGKAGK